MTTNIIPENLNNSKTMSSVEIAGLTGKKHFHVVRDIETTLDEAEIDASKFGGIYLDARNREKKCYNLPKRECDLVMSGYSVKYRMAIIDRWIELENRNELVIPKTLPNALRAYALEVEKNAEQQLVIDQQEKSIQNKDELIIATNEANIKAGNIKVREFCKSIDFVDVGQNIMFDWFRKQGYIMNSNEPYQQYVQMGYFVWKPTAEKINGKFRYTLMITPKGKVALTARYFKFLEI